MPIKEFLRSRKFLFTCISVVIFLVGVFIFKMEPMNLAGAISVLTAPYLLSNVASRFASNKKEK